MPSPTNADTAAAASSSHSNGTVHLASQHGERAGVMGAHRVRAVDLPPAGRLGVREPGRAGAERLEHPLARDAGRVRRGRRDAAGRPPWTSTVTGSSRGTVMKYGA